MKLNKALFLLPLVALSQHLVASVTISFEFEALRDSSGIPLSGDTYTILVADSNKDSIFPSPSDLLGAQLNLGDDIAGNRIFYSGTFNGSIFDDTAASLEASDLGLSDNTEIDGTRWAVYWFPGLSSAPGASGLQQGQNYGFFHSDQIDPTAQAFGATASMVMPPDGTQAQTILYFDTETENTSAPSVQDFTADLTVVPEPSTLLLVGLASFAFLLRRRI